MHATRSENPEPVAINQMMIGEAANDWHMGGSHAAMTQPWRGSDDGKDDRWRAQ
jgi:hypothetical protein